MNSEAVPIPENPAEVTHACLPSCWLACGLSLCPQAVLNTGGHGLSTLPQWPCLVTTWPPVLLGHDLLRCLDAGNGLCPGTFSAGQCLNSHGVSVQNYLLD